jgi:hypothetical protein
MQGQPSIFKEHKIRQTFDAQSRRSLKKNTEKGGIEGVRSLSEEIELDYKAELAQRKLVQDDTDYGVSTMARRENRCSFKDQEAITFKNQQKGIETKIVPSNEDFAGELKRAGTQIKVMN